jgi:hypothetical protein
MTASDTMLSTRLDSDSHRSGELLSMQQSSTGELAMNSGTSHDRPLSDDVVAATLDNADTTVTGKLSRNQKRNLRRQLKRKHQGSPPSGHHNTHLSVEERPLEGSLIDEVGLGDALSVSNGSAPSESNDSINDDDSLSHTANDCHSESSSSGSSSMFNRRSILDRLYPPITNGLKKRKLEYPLSSVKESPHSSSSSSSSSDYSLPPLDYHSSSIYYRPPVEQPMQGLVSDMLGILRTRSLLHGNECDHAYAPLARYLSSNAVSLPPEFRDDLIYQFTRRAVDLFHEAYPELPPATSSAPTFRGLYVADIELFRTAWWRWRRARSAALSTTYDRPFLTLTDEIRDVLRAEGDALTDLLVLIQRQPRHTTLPVGFESEIDPSQNTHDGDGDDNAGNDDDCASDGHNDDNDDMCDDNDDDADGANVIDADDDESSLDSMYYASFAYPSTLSTTLSSDQPDWALNELFDESVADALYAAFQSEMAIEDARRDYEAFQKSRRLLKKTTPKNSERPARG